MSRKLTNSIENYKYLFKSNFYVKNYQYLILFFISILSLVTSFATIYTSIPFLDIILAKSPNDYQKITVFTFSTIEKLNLSPSFIICALILLISIFFKSIVDILYQFYCTKLQFLFMQKEASELNKKIFNMDQIFYLKFSSSKVLNLFTKELERSSDIFSIFFVSFNAFLQLIVYLIVPIYLNAKLTLMFFGILIFLLSPLIFINYLTIKLGKKSTTLGDDLYRALNNNLNSSKFISIHGLFKNADKYFNKSYKGFAENKIQLTILGSIIRNYLQPIGIISIIIPVSFFLEDKNNLPIIGAILWSLTRTLAPVNVLLNGIKVINSEIPALKNLYDTKFNFNQFQIENGNKSIDKIDEISFKKINFSYGEKVIFKNLDFKISKGQKIAIIGDTGSGKSTFLDILANVTKVSSGQRFVNNINYTDLDFIKFRSKISYIPQSLSITDSTVKEFFNFFNENTNIDNIYHYLDLMNCRGFLEKKDDILDTYLGDKGMKLSGGQKQKIILAAALSRAPEILILDETTNALDAINEDEVIKKILLDKNLILIFISHKLPKTDYFDKKYLVKDNNLILESGT